MKTPTLVLRLKCLLVRREIRVVSRRRLMAVLDSNFEEAGVRITVRRYNQILTDLGFHLEDL